MTITVSTQLKAHFAQPYQTVCTCWKVTLKNTTVLGFTDHDCDVVFLGVTYKAAVGYTRSDIAGAADLSVDNLEVVGILNSPSINEADLHAGIWDFADVEMFVVNWADLTMGKMYQRVGKIGEVTIDRGFFHAELRGLTQAFSRQIGELTSPGCRNTLGDARCTVNLAPFTVTGTVTGVAADNQTIYDTARTEPGPTGGAVLNAVSGGNIANISPALGLPNGAPVVISGMAGSGNAATFNVVSPFLNPNTVGSQFQLQGTLTGSYTSNSGTVTPLGANSGYFDFGVITWTSGLNTGLQMEVRSYVPGQITLQLPMVYAIQVGDAYSLRAGCDKSVTTCKAKFSNVINMRAEPYLPGFDKIMQVGKQGGG